MRFAEAVLVAGAFLSVWSTLSVCIFVSNYLVILSGFPVKERPECSMSHPTTRSPSVHAESSVTDTHNPISFMQFPTTIAQTTLDFLAITATH